MKHLFNFLLITICCSNLIAQKVSLEASEWSTPKICENCATCQDTMSHVSTSQKKLAFYCNDLLAGRWQLTKHTLSVCDSSYYTYTRGDQEATHPNLRMSLQSIFSQIKTGCSSSSSYDLEILGDVKDEVSEYFLGHFGTRRMTIVNPERKIMVDQKIYDIDQLDSEPYITTCIVHMDKEERIECSQKEISAVIYQYIKYPVEAREKGISGTAMVDLIIDESGDIVDAELTQDLDGGCGQAALDAAYSIIGRGLKFTPGYIDGEVVTTRFSLPMNFKLW